MLGAFLFELGPRDRAGPLLEGLLDASLDSGTAGGIQHTYSYSVPNDRAMLLTSVCLRAFAAAGTAVTMQVRIDSDTTVEGLLHYEVAGAGLGQAAINRAFDHVLVKPSTRLVLNAAFTAANAGNVSSAGMSGVLIPRGNLAFFRLPRSVVVI